MNETSTVMDRVRAKPMVAWQYAIIGICLLTNLLDGFDTLAMAFTAPAVARDLSLAPDLVGALLGSGLAGTAIGALTLSPLADIKGRKPIIIVCLILIASGMFFAGAASTFQHLVIARLITGIGIGGILGAISALLFEYASVRARGVAMGLMAVTFPAGAVIGGGLAVQILKSHGWQPVFLAGGIATLAVIPVCFLLPESIDYLLERRPSNHMRRVNQILSRLGSSPLSEAPSSSNLNDTTSSLHLFRPPLRIKFVQLSAVMFLLLASLYFMLSWAPKLVVESGHSANSGIFASMLMNFGGMLGGVSVGPLMRLVGQRNCTIGVFAGMAVGIALFGSVSAHLLPMQLASFALGFFIYSGMALAVLLMTGSFPARIRSTSVGLCMTVGRVGSVVGPYAAGLLLSLSFPVGLVCILMGLPALAAAALVAGSARLLPAAEDRLASKLAATHPLRGL